MTHEWRAHLALRVGVAFTFLYPPIAAISDPVSWFAYFPRFFRAIPIDSLVLLHGFGAIEIALALWVLSGKNIRPPAILMTLILLAIAAFNWTLADVVFRDLSIAATTIALALWPNAGSATAPNERRPSPLSGRGGRG